jgi:hypothetical protein
MTETKFESSPTCWELCTPYLYVIGVALDSCLSCLKLQCLRLCSKEKKSAASVPSTGPGPVPVTGKGAGVLPAIVPVPV